MVREDKSEFYPILETLIDDTPGASAAIFSDNEGESIEFCGNMDTYDIKVIGAYAAVILPMLRTRYDHVPMLTIISCRNLTLYLRCMDTYILTLVLQGRTYAAGLEEAIERAVGQFACEAGIKVEP